jgi:hypothetical protein
MRRGKGEGKEGRREKGGGEREKEVGKKRREQSYQVSHERNLPSG